MNSRSQRSHTAEGVAAIRAAGTRDPNPAARNPDHLADRMIGPRYRLLSRPPLRAAMIRRLDRTLPGLYRFITARTKHFDALLLASVDIGAEQVVILGAGADSRAHRFADRLRGVQVYELDHPATQAWKVARLRRARVASDSDVSYIPVDFNAETLDTVLDRGEVRRDRPTFFLWEGVTPYLSAEAVDAVLRTVATFAPRSGIAFDYIDRIVLEDPSTYPGAAKYFDYLGRHGEPLVFGFDPATIGEELDKCGLGLMSNALADDLEERHLGGPDKVLTMQPFSVIAHAVVPG